MTGLEGDENREGVIGGRNRHQKVKTLQSGSVVLLINKSKDFDATAKNASPASASTPAPENRKVSGAGVCSELRPAFKIRFEAIGKTTKKKRFCVFKPWLND